MEARVQKIISQWGIASRRQAEEMIGQSRVRVNGNLARLGQKVDPKVDMISIDGKPVTQGSPPALVYLLLNKPAGVVSTCNDPQGRTTVLDLLPTKLRQGTGICPVGRLDADSTGALILTNDGDVTFALTHPSHDVPKTYHVVVEGHPPTNVLRMWSQGVMLDGRKTRTAQVKLIEQGFTQSKLEIILQEGRNRQIRRVAQQLGYPVVHLDRRAIGTIELHNSDGKFTDVGKYRHLITSEIILLQHLVHQIRN
ncbi:pseudouridine synthase [Cylindrospermopsis raciborskii CENA303]|uniref:Pseudouridine synthase n=1 Tax=Cylindrospermopsis raciborskii CENA303 TaxID=1170769 RepID=A0A1X4GJJ2_9CYAN|nr:pseudouridine synthase [Cylindrospermopsis raciborskii]OSO97298.1 pseudouridine synthase [Cylindrospermopsis raciborskii CENA303]